MSIHYRFLEAEGLEKTYKFSQKEIANASDIASAAKVSFLFICLMLLL